MSRPNLPVSPWARRALAGTLPPADYTAMIASSRETLATLARERVTISGRSWTVADLQRAIAREHDR